MKRSGILRATILFFSIAAFFGCGVKGRPLPPLEPIRPGDGTPRSEKEKKKQTPSPPSKPGQR